MIGVLDRIGHGLSLVAKGDYHVSPLDFCRAD